MRLLFLLLLMNAYCVAATYYLDPAVGSLANDGSVNAPWPSLEEVIAADLIQQHRHWPLPYNAATDQPVLRNPSAPITAGDTLLLRDGLHGECFLRNYVNSSFLTVMADKGHRPILRNIHLQAGRNWRFVGLTVSHEPYGFTTNKKLVHVESHGFQGPVTQIEISNCTIYSADLPWTVASEWVAKARDGIYARGDSIMIRDNHLRNIDMGITAYGDYITAERNTITNFSGDGMRPLGAHIVFRGNMIKNCYAVDGNHDDGIQSFTINGIVADDVLIEENIILNYEDPEQPLLGPLQGIGCFDGMYNDWVVQNNLVVVNHWHGITFLGANNCLIVNNTVLDPSPAVTPGASWIRVADHKDGRPSTGCTIKNNVANRFVVTGEERANVVLPTLTEYANYFVSFPENDFHLLATSALIDAGDNALAPQVDLEGTPRPQGTAVDIGCYEFVPPVSVEEVSEREIRLFPNPAAEVVNLRVPSLPVGGTWRLSSQTGSIVRTGTLNGGQSKIDVSDLPAGAYLLGLYRRNGGYFGAKWLIRR